MEFIAILRVLWRRRVLVVAGRRCSRPGACSAAVAEPTPAGSRGRAWRSTRRPSQVVARDARRAPTPWAGARRWSPISRRRRETARPQSPASRVPVDSLGDHRAGPGRARRCPRRCRGACRRGGGADVRAVRAHRDGELETATISLRGHGPTAPRPARLNRGHRAARWRRGVTRRHGRAIQAFDVTPASPVTAREVVELPRSHHRGRVRLRVPLRLWCGADRRRARPAPAARASRTPRVRPTERRRYAAESPARGEAPSLTPWRGPPLIGQPLRALGGCLDRTSVSLSRWL